MWKNMHALLKNDAGLLVGGTISGYSHDNSGGFYFLVSYKSMFPLCTKGMV